VYDLAKEPPSDLPGVVLADMREPLSEAWVARLKLAAEAGGTVHLSCMRPGTKLQAETICGQSLLVYPLRESRGFQGRVFKRVASPLLSGISNLELCWLENKGGDGNFFTKPGYVAAEILEYECRPAGNVGADLVFPHALLDFRVGKGRVIVNQMRGMEQVGAAQERADRLAVALLTNLNVRLIPPRPKLVMPKGVKKKIVDMRSVMNRSLTDDKDNDGVGGWSDQGAIFDMRNLPTGAVNSGGVPFNILSENQACLVLSSERRKKMPNLRESVSIPVNRKLAGCWFLHSMAWGGNPGSESYRFVMEYENGQNDSAKVIAAVNAWDWARPLPHTFSGSNRAWTALTTKCAGFAQVSVYALEWVNPHPERVVKTIRFQSVDLNTVPILLGVTLALPGKIKAAPKLVAQNMTEQESRRCQSLRAAGKTDALIVELRTILKKNPAKVDAQKLLALTLWEDRKDYKGAEANFLTAMTYTGESVALLNQLGRLNEMRRQYGKALDYYQRSLKIEWNQPPTMAGMDRMKKALK
jgi:hypothetical protein